MVDIAVYSVSPVILGLSKCSGKTDPDREKKPLNRSKNVHRLKNEKKRSKDSHRKCKSFINNKKAT